MVHGILQGLDEVRAIAFDRERPDIATHGCVAVRVVTGADTAHHQFTFPGLVLAALPGELGDVTHPAALRVDAGTPAEAPEKEGAEDADDGQDDQEFNQGKPAVSSILHG